MTPEQFTSIAIGQKPVLTEDVFTEYDDPPICLARKGDVVVVQYVTHGVSGYERIYVSHEDAPDVTFLVYRHEFHVLTGD